MKRFFFLSIFFHGFLLLLLFSRETPLANKFSPKVLIHVSLIERIEEKKPEKVLRPILKEPERVKTPEKKEVLPSPVKEEVEKEEKREEKIEQAQPILKEERRKDEEEVPSRNKALTPQVEQPLVAQAKTIPQPQAGGNPEVLQPLPEGKGDSRAKEGSGSTFLASAAFGVGAEGIGPGRGSGAPGGGRREGAPGQMANIGPSSGGLDPILSLIIRKIEAAKRYPRMARKMGIEGTAVVRFKLRSEGQVETVEIMESSGSEILDKASIETVRDAAPLPYKDGWLKVGIAFKII
ncbi:MAG: energy transducer TonB [Thermodesulfobacteriota bacterium]